MTPKITLISGTFYPHPHVASVRVTYWARMLAESGWQVQVICKNHGHLASQHDLDQALCPGIQVHALDKRGRPTPTPAQSTAPAAQSNNAPPPGQPNPGILRLAMSRLIVPDVQRVYWKRALPHIASLVSTFSPDIVLTTSPQHSIHLVGKHLKRAHGTTWAADYRDPHLIDPRFVQSGIGCLVRPLHAKFEREVYRHADLILHAIPLHQRWARRAYPNSAHQIHCLPHPVPADLAEKQSAPLPASVAGRYVIRVVGKIRADIISALMDAVAKISADPSSSLDPELTLVGKPIPISDHHRELLGDRLIMTGRVRHDIAKQYIAGADLLVNALGVDDALLKGVSSKLFEFAAAGRPIIHINPTKPDRHLTRQIAGITLMKNPDADQIAEAISDTARSYREQVPDRSKFLDLYSEANHKKRLLDCLSELLTA